ncbi:C-type lectin domain family 6 member A-like [Panulirus ornatus]|uniref:C-type lectin domain family 6 member A-like n=1 Tax=Panulirus ornatus TaxID=150431 RepID=UPI003A862C22
MHVLAVGMLLVALMEATNCNRLDADGNQVVVKLDDNCTRSLAELLLRQQTHPAELVNLGNNVAATTLTGVVNMLTQLRDALLTGLNVAVDQNKQCSPPYSQVGKNCLLLTTEQFTWAASREFCGTTGGDLATFSDANTYAEYLGFINSVHPSVTGSVWIGGSDEAIEGIWTWVTGELMPKGVPFWGSTNNYRPEPGSGRGENCAILYFPDRFYVHDISCTVKAAPLCMKNI